MKELYTSPELELICFAPCERLADQGEFTLGDLDSGNGGSLGGGTESNEFDVVGPIGKLLGL